MASRSRPKARHGSLAQAEQAALQGDNESQDSQQVLSLYMNEYGIGLTSSSPAPSDADHIPAMRRNHPPQAHQMHPGNHKKVTQTYVGSGRTGRRAGLQRTPASDQPLWAPQKDGEAWATGDHSRRDAVLTNSTHRNTGAATSTAGRDISDSHSNENTAHPVQPHSTPKPPKPSFNSRHSSPVALDDEDIPPQITGLHVDAPHGQITSPDPFVRSDFLPRFPTSTATSRKTMDEEPSQSPTQSNDGRSYEKYFQQSSENDPAHVISSDSPHVLESSPHHTSHGKSHDVVASDENGTGVVSFGLSSLPAYDAARSSVPETSGMVDFAALSRPVDEHSQDGFPHLTALNPETPAPPKNPFATHNAAPLLGGSQLFRQTQFSSAVRRVSPTSSRPSPNDFPLNSISPNPIISSPLKTRGLQSSPLGNGDSSPQILPATSPGPLEEEAVTPYDNDEKKDPMVPESPGYDSPRKRPAPGPLEDYEPMRMSQARRKSSKTRSISDSSDEESALDELAEKQRRAKERRAEGTKQLTSISFQRPPSSDDVEVPSTNKRKGRSRLQARQHVVQREGRDNSDNESQETVADSQEQAVRNAINNRHGEDDSALKDVGGSPVVTQVLDRAPGPSSSISRFPAHGSHTNMSGTNLRLDMNAAETIPETSPTEAGPRPFADMDGQPSSNVSRPVSFPSLHSDPPTQRSSLKNTIEPKSSQQEMGPEQSDETMSEIPGAQGKPTSQVSHRLSQDAGIPSLSSEDGEEPELSSQSRDHIKQISSAAAIGSSPPALSTRSRTKRDGTSRTARTPGDPSSSAPRTQAASASALSSLSTTPSLSNRTTPLTQESASAGKTDPRPVRDARNSSPAVDKSRRRETHEALPRLKTEPAADLRTSVRLTRNRIQQDPDSTDELARSRSATPTFEHSLRNPRLGRLVSKGQPSSREQSRGSGVFAGMVFAVSFQSRKPGESLDHFDVREKFAESIERKIEQGGGRVLSGGFDELFEVSQMKSAETSPSAPSQPNEEVRLTPAARYTGFTALIADGHSRKAKYMQALALGLPCIAHRWITTCLDKQEIVDWSPYLLCAGVSTFLGDAIRSRNLAPFDARSAKLDDVIEGRPRLLQGNRILLVAKKSEANKKEAYVFLARVLGASLSRAYTVDEARTKLKAMEKLGCPFDWVYVDGKHEKGDLFLSVPSAKEGKKRKRASSNRDAPLPSKRVRTLSDELVIQSLILGRLIEEDEMDV